MPEKPEKGADKCEISHLSVEKNAKKKKDRPVKMQVDPSSFLMGFNYLSPLTLYLSPNFANHHRDFTFAYEIPESYFLRPGPGCRKTQIPAPQWL
jgi:hypothetical protein